MILCRATFAHHTHQPQLVLLHVDAQNEEQRREDDAEDAVGQQAVLLLCVWRGIRSEVGGARVTGREGARERRDAADEKRTRPCLLLPAREPARGCKSRARGALVTPQARRGVVLCVSLRARAIASASSPLSSTTKEQELTTS
jgi:hypothetical protein